MNRLVLLGNGFDLAHGLKTSYKDFLLWYLKTSFRTAYQDDSFADNLLEIGRDISVATYEIKTNLNHVDKLIDYCYQNGFDLLIENRPMTITGLNASFSRSFTVNVKSSFLKELLYNCKCDKWVDIENYFYTELKSILNPEYHESIKEEKLANLNDSLGSLIIQLEIYFASLKPAERLSGYDEILSSTIKQNEVHGINLESEQIPYETLILNFNYTNTIKRYLEFYKIKDGSISPKVNYIHGQIGSKTNRLVFGFGDELDQAYLKMEIETAVGYFQYIKSFWYFKTSNYRDLVGFIDAEPYQIFILGHSCGLSDRTMLHMLFEHANCKSIKIYYYVNEFGENNFTSLTYEIARHFKDKEEMRKKIVSFNNSTSMPQARTKYL